MPFFRTFDLMRFLVTIFAVLVFTLSYSQQIEKGKYRVRLSAWNGLFFDFQDKDSCKVFYHDDSGTHLETKGTYKVRGSNAIIQLDTTKHDFKVNKYLLTFSENKWWFYLEYPSKPTYVLEKFDWKSF